MHTIYVGDDWLFVDQISIKVGKSVYEFEVDVTRDVVSGSLVAESWVAPVTGKLMEAMQEIAFGKGEQAIAFRGKNKSAAYPLSAESTNSLMVTLLAYIAAGGKDGLPPKGK